LHSINIHYLNIYTALCINQQTAREPLDLFSDKIAFKAPGTDLEGNGSPLNLGLDLFQIGLPGAAGMVFRVAHRIAGNRVLSAYIADPGHNKPSLIYPFRENNRPQN
jgi:hypothetical protein